MKFRGKVIFSVVCVKNSVHRGGSASVHAGIPPTGPGTPHGTRHPRHQAPSGADPPGTRHPLDQAPHRADPLGPDPPCAVHAGRYGQRAGAMHPTRMQSCLRLNLAMRLSNLMIL